MTGRRYQDTRPDFSKSQMKNLLSVFCHRVVRKLGINRPMDVDGAAVDEVYSYLWANDELKFATEIHLDAGTVEKYLWEAAEKKVG